MSLNTIEKQKIRSDFENAPELQYIFISPERVEKPELFAICNYFLALIEEREQKKIEEIKELKKFYIYSDHMAFSRKVEVRKKQAPIVENYNHAISDAIKILEK